MRIPHLLWVIAAIFVASCFFSGAWLARELPTIQPVTTTSRVSPEERADQERLHKRERETVIATAIGSPIAVLILFLTGVVVSGIATKDSAASKPRTNSDPAQKKTG